MTPKVFKIFASLGVASIVLRFLAVAGRYLVRDYYSIFDIIDIIGHFLFLSMFFFVAKDLKQNYGKNVRPIYLFVFSSVVISISAILFSLPRDITLFMRLLFFAVIVIFIVYLLKTAYRLFAVVFVISIIALALFRITFTFFFPDAIYTYLKFESVIPSLYPLVLIYIVRTKEDSLMKEIEAIGSDMEE